MIFKLFYFFNRICWYPVLRWIAPLINARARARIKFEKKSKHPAFQSFKREGLKADFAFECSSEGEFEQIITLVLYLLNQGKRVELVYCSDSVDHRCMDLYTRYPENLRLLRLPILRYFPLLVDPQNWLSASVFYLCRYDFFPELIFYGRQKHVQFHLLWAKASEQRGIASWYYDWVYASFNKVVAATAQDGIFLGARYGYNEHFLNVHDFRPLQIANRLKLKEETLSLKFPHYQLYKELLDYYPKNKRLIFGSFWDYELPVFLGEEVHKFLAAKGFIACVPHDLSQANIEKIKSALTFSNLPYYEIHQNITAQDFQELIQQMKTMPGIILINLKGVLCELYADFATSFVGGGHGISIHSVLEPYVAGSKVYCGPKVHRSTEYQLISGRDPDKIQIVPALSQFFSFIQEDLKLEYKEVAMNLDDYIVANQVILKWLNLS